MYDIRLAKEEDLDNILKIYAQARSFMARTGNPDQWKQSYPACDVLMRDIAQGTLHVVIEKETTHGVFVFIPGEDPTYRYIEGAWHRDKPYYAIHRVASDGSGGIFRTILAYCSTVSDYLRIDTHRDNKVMQHVVEKSGFQRCGIIYLENGDPRIAYDRA